MAEVTAGLERARSLLHAHKHMRARAVLQESIPDAAAREAAVAADAEMARLMRVTAAVDQLRADLADTADWQLARRDAATTTYMQVVDAGLARVRVEGWVDAPAVSLLGVLYEVHLHRLWMPHYAGMGTKQGRMMAQFSPTSFWIEIDIDVPWPWNARRASMAVTGVDCLDYEPGKRRQVVVVLKSVDTAEQLKEETNGIYVAPGYKALEPGAAPTTEDGGVLVGVHLAGFVLTPAELNPELGRSHGTLVQLAARIDPRMPSLPTCAINVGVKHLAHYMLEAMSKMALRVSDMPEYQTAMKKNPEFYDFINGRLAEAMAEMAGAGSGAAVSTAGAVAAVAVAPPVETGSAAAAAPAATEQDQKHAAGDREEAAELEAAVAQLEVVGKHDADARSVDVASTNGGAATVEVDDDGAEQR